MALEECNRHTIVRLPNSVFRPYAAIGTNLLFVENGAPAQDIWFWEHRVPEGQKAYSKDPAHPAGAPGRLRRLVGRTAPRGATGAYPSGEGRLASVRSV